MTIFAPTHIQSQRRSICDACEFKSRISVCMKCGCVIPAKVKMAMSRCPEGKWDKYDENTEKK